MAKSTFSGPVRSEDTFKTVSKAAATGTITEVITAIKLEEAKVADRENAILNSAPEVSVAT